MSTLVKEQFVEYVPVSSLKFAPFNPASRTEKKAIVKLMREVEKAGKIISPLIVTRENFVADGHRRLTVARELGYEVVPIIREDMTLADLWSILNGGNMAVNRKTWMQAVREGMPFDCVPDNEKAILEELIRIVGKKMFNELADNRRSPYIGRTAKFVGRYCGDDSDAFCKKIILWFEEHNTQSRARTAMTQQCPPDVLMAAIVDNRPIRQFWGVA